MLTSGLTVLFKLEIPLNLLEDPCQVSACPVQGPETHLLPYMEVGLKIFEFPNNSQTWCFKKQDLKWFFPVVICSVEGGIMDQNSRGILYAVIYSSSI